MIVGSTRLKHEINAHRSDNKVTYAKKLIEKTLLNVLTSIDNINITKMAHFKNYKAVYSQQTGNSAPEQIGLSFTAGRHMLRIKPEERQSAIGSLGRGEFLWYMSDQVSHGGNKTSTRENPPKSFPTFQTPKMYQKQRLRLPEYRPQILVVAC